MSKEEIIEHKNKYSKAGNSQYSPWSTQFDLMANKTVLKLLLSRYGLLSTEMQVAIKTDQSVIKNIDEEQNIEVEYVDNPNYTNEENVETVEEVLEEKEEFNNIHKELEEMF